MANNRNDIWPKFAERLANLQTDVTNIVMRRPSCSLVAAVGNFVFSINDTNPGIVCTKLANFVKVH